MPQTITIYPSILGNRCELCGEKFTSSDETGEFGANPYTTVVRSIEDGSEIKRGVYAHVQCALDAGMVVA